MRRHKHQNNSKMKTVCSLIWIICICGDAYCQDFNKIDRLKETLTTTQSDTIKGLMIYSLATEYMWIKPDTTLYYSNMGLELIKDPEIQNQFQDAKNPILRSF